MVGRRTFDGTEIMTILRRHLVDKVPISDLCDEYKIQPTHFYRWQKKIFEEGASLFERGGNGTSESKRQAEKIEALEAKLGRKDGVLAELMEEHVALKKSLGEA